MFNLTLLYLCSKSKHRDSEEPEGSHLVPAMEENEEVSSVSKEVHDATAY